MGCFTELRTRAAPEHLPPAPRPANKGEWGHARWAGFWGLVEWLPVKIIVEPVMDDQTRTELEAAAFRTLVSHLRERTDVQNIDLMNLAGFCRNCLSKWYRAAAEDQQIELSYDDAREIVYGMPYGEWKDQFQKEASAEQLGTFKQNAE